MNELEAFHRFLGNQLTNGDRGLTPEECVELWRAGTPDADELDSDVLGIKDALDDIENGDQGMPLQDFLADVRGNKHSRDDLLRQEIIAVAAAHNRF